MNGFDFIVIGVTAAGAIYGLRQGLLRMVTSAIALGGAIYVASVYYADAGAIAQNNLGAEPTVAAVVGYVAVFILIFAAIEVIGSTAVRLLHIVHLGWADRLAGSLLGASLVAVAAGIAVMLLAAVLPRDAGLLKNSQLAPMLIEYNETLARYIPQEAREAYETNRDNLLRDWIARAAKTVTRSAPSPQASPSPGTDRK